MYKKLMIALGLGTQLLVYSAASSVVSRVEAEVEQFDTVRTKEMFDAIDEYDCEKLQQILMTQKVNVNAIGSTNETPLVKVIGLFCSLEKKIKMVTQLLMHGGDLMQGVTCLNSLPIHYVSCIEREWGSSALIYILLSWNKKCLNAQDVNGVTPLMIAIVGTGSGKMNMSIGDAALREKSAEDKATLAMGIIKALLAHDADIAHLKCVRNVNALELAAELENPAVIKVLDEHNRKTKEKIVACMRQADKKLFYFPPGLLPLISEYVQ